MKKATPKPDEELSPEDRENFYRLLQDLHNHYEPYHARKENSIWLATTIYAGALLTFIPAVAGRLVASPWSWAAVALILATGGLTLMFILSQFSDREFAAHVVAVCGDLRSQLTSPHRPLRYRDLIPRQRRSKINNQRYVLPAVLWASLWCRERKTKERRKGGLAVRYNWKKCSLIWLIVLWTVAAMIFILFSEGAT